MLKIDFNPSPILQHDDKYLDFREESRELNENENENDEHDLDRQDFGLLEV